MIEFRFQSFFAFCFYFFVITYFCLRKNIKFFNNFFYYYHHTKIWISTCLSSLWMSSEWVAYLNSFTTSVIGILKIKIKTNSIQNTERNFWSSESLSVCSSSQMKFGKSFKCDDVGNDDAHANISILIIAHWLVITDFCSIFNATVC